MPFLSESSAKQREIKCNLSGAVHMMQTIEPPMQLARASKGVSY